MGIDHVTADLLHRTVVAATSAETHPQFRSIAPEGHVEYFTLGPVAQLIEDATIREAAMAPVIEEVIRFRTAIGEPLIVDYWLLEPARVAAMDGVVSVWIHIDPVALEARERAISDFWNASDDPEAMLANFMGRSLWRNETLRREADRLDLLVLEQPGDIPVSDLADAVIDRLGLSRPS